MIVLGARSHKNHSGLSTELHSDPLSLHLHRPSLPSKPDISRRDIDGIRFTKIYCMRLTERVVNLLLCVVCSFDSGRWQCDRLFNAGSPAPTITTSFKTHFSETYCDILMLNEKEMRKILKNLIIMNLRVGIETSRAGCDMEQV